MARYMRCSKRQKTLDLGLDEIKDIRDLQRGGEQPCQRVTSMLDTHLAGIDQKLADLRRLRDSLRNARRAAATARHDGNPAVVCQIIESAPASPALGPGELRASRGARARLGRG